MQHTLHWNVYSTNRDSAHTISTEGWSAAVHVLLYNAEHVLCLYLSVWDETAVKHAHLFLAGGAGCVGGGGACTQSLLDVEIELVEFPHQLVHRLRPGRLDLRRYLRVIRRALI